MKTLILDTSGPKALAALTDTNNLLSFQYFAHEGRLSELYLNVIDEILHEAAVPLSQIDQFAVGIGPGSYTGTRVAVTMGRSFALGKNIPCVGFPSSALFIPKRDGRFLILTKGKYSNHHVLILKVSQGEVTIENCSFHSLDNIHMLAQDVELVDPVESQINIGGLCQYISIPSHLLPPLPLYFPIAEYLPNP